MVWLIKGSILLPLEIVRGANDFHGGGVIFAFFFQDVFTSD